MNSEEYLKAQEAEDSRKVHILMRDCSQSRENTLVVLRSLIALEYVLHRLIRINSVEDFASNLDTVLNVIARAKEQISLIIPDAAGNLGEVFDMSDLMVLDAATVSSEALASKEAEKILEEASKIAERKMKELFLNLY